MAKIVKNINSSERIRHFDIVFYGSDTELLKIIHTYRVRIQRYAFIKHDCDVYSEDLKDENDNYIHRKGDVKKVHYHLIISFYNACTLRACSRLFKTENDSPRVFSIGDMGLAYDYLIHKNDLDKYQYSKTDITSDDLNYYEKLLLHGEKKESDNIAEQIVLDLIAGVSTRVLLSRYGRDFVIHQSQYRDCADKIKQEDIELKWQRERAEKEKSLGLEPVQIDFNDIF